MPSLSLSLARFSCLKSAYSALIDHATSARSSTILLLLLTRLSLPKLTEAAASAAAAADDNDDPDYCVQCVPNSY